MSLGSFSWIWCDGIFKWFLKSSVKSHRLYFWLLSTVSFQMRPQIPCLNKCVITLVALRLTFPQCVLSSVSSNRLHESTLVALCPHCENILTSKGLGRRSWWTIKFLYTLQADPKNPGTSFSNFQLKIPGYRDSRDPARAWWWVEIGERKILISSNPPCKSVKI